MKWMSLLCLCLLLTGCSVQTAQWETVADLTSVENDPPAYSITVGLPEEAVTDKTEGRCRYETQNYWVETGAFYATDAESAIETLSGFSAEKLTVLKTSRFDLPEYQFAWFCQTEEGGRLCRADLVMDGMTCYAVVCSVPESAGEEPWAEARQVFSSFGLSPAEAV